LHLWLSQPVQGLIDVPRRPLGSGCAVCVARPGGGTAVAQPDAWRTTLQRCVQPGDLDRRRASQASILAGNGGAGKIDREVIQVRTRPRQIRIGVRTFVWRAEIRHVQGSDDCHRCIRLRVWGAGKTSQALQADLLSVAWPAPWGACAADGAYPTPVDVRAVISHALEHGWQPEMRGGTFVLSEHEHGAGFVLPDFLLTDRLRTLGSADPTARVIRAHELRHRA
jgi:hypothetical protein